MEKRSYRELAENIPNFIVRYDRNLRRIYVNPAWEAASGLSFAEVVGRPADTIPRVSCAVVQEYAVKLRKVFETGALQEAEFPWTNADGVELYLSYVIVPERDARGEIVSVLSVGHDISQRKRTEDRLRAQEESLRKLSRAVEQCPASIVITDTSGAIDYVNPKFTEVTGYSREDVLGKNPRILKSGDMSPERYREMWQTISSGKEWRGEFHNRRKNGDLYWESVSISPVHDATGTITHYLAIKEDVTERKRLEGDFRQAQKMEAVGQLAGGVAHDFNNILMAIGGNAELLKSGRLNAAERAEALDEISSTVERAARLTQQLLLFGRRQATQLKDLDLNGVVLDVAKLLRRLIGEHVELIARCASEGAFVLADAGMMEQIVINLAVNSRDAMPNGGRLDVGVDVVSVDEEDARRHLRGRAGKFVRLTVGDNGCGIAPENIPRVFEPFFTTKDVGRGTGLGLATVFGIVEQHQGWISLESRVGEGTTFRIFLPYTGRRVAPAAAKRAPSRELDGTETILLVEDEPAVRRVERKILLEHGYRVHEADSGVVALQVWARHRDEISLLLTDMVMPEGIGGRELGERLLAEKPSLKVIYATGYSDEFLGAAPGERGADDFLGKPCTSAELLRKVRARLDVR